MFKQFFSLAKDTWQEFQDDEAMHMSAALSYYALFSLLPLLLLLTAILGFALQVYPAAQDAQTALLNWLTVTFSAGLADTIAGVLEGVQDNASAATWLGLITLLLGASGVFQQLDDSFNKIWKVPKAKLPFRQMVRQLVLQKSTSFLMVIAIGALLIVSAVLTGVTETVVNGANELFGIADDSWLSGIAGLLAGWGVAFLLNVLIFALLFRLLPDTTVLWSDIWPGAILTALLWEIAKRALAIYIGSMGRSFSAYGAIGSVLVLVAWIYFSSLVLYLGAEFTYVASKHRKAERDARVAQTVEHTPLREV